MKSSYCITGVTYSGNMGGQAMLLTALQVLGKSSEDTHFYLLSISPSRDKSFPLPSNLEIVNSAPPVLMLFYLPLSILAFPFRRMKVVQKLLARLPLFAALQSSKAVVDLCGIAFSDKRGLPLLLYNVACCLPALVVQTPVHKLAQALGPFHQSLNRLLSKWVLQRCREVISRGTRTFQNLAEIQVTSACRPDVSFSLEVGERDIAEAKNRLHKCGIHTQSPIVFSPSRVVQRMCEKQGINFESEFVGGIKKLIRLGYPILLLPHSLGSGNSKNNDRSLCREIYRQCGGAPVYLIDDLENAVQLRALIGLAHAFVGCRFHSVVAALSMGVPAVVFGWGHKYFEMVEPFGLQDWVFDSKAVSATSIDTQVSKLIERQAELRAQIKSVLPSIVAQSRENFAQLLSSGHRKI